jgi:CRISPR-associated endonuclease Cas1
MRHHPNRPGSARRSIVHVATGYSIRVRVDGGHLVVDDGTGRDRRSVRFNRVTGRLSHLVVIGTTGYVTLDALRWMTDVGCGFVHLDHTGRLVATSATVGVDTPPLRRALALAAGRPVGVEIARELLTAKLHGQATVADTLSADAAQTIRDHLRHLQTAASIDELRVVESQAAAAYWAAWRGIRVRFPNQEATDAPVHWATFAQRASALTGNPRVAVDPINAVLNYLYAILEAQARLALAAVGLDPGLGIIHADQRARDSLALDLMEAVRPNVDAYVLALVAARQFTLKDFHEARNGQCRLMPRLARELATTAPTWGADVAPHAEAIASLLSKEAGLPQPPTPLTGATRRQARPAGDQRRPPKPSKPIIRTAACAQCGATLPLGQKRCARCHATFNAQRIAREGTEVAARRRRTGSHPSQEPAVRERIAEQQREHWRARRSSKPSSGFTGQPSEFRRLILPRLAGLTSQYLAHATGLSPGYCAQIRDGRRVPDPRHWPAFQLAGLSAATADSTAS